MRYTIELEPVPEGTALSVAQRVTYLDGETSSARMQADEDRFAAEMPGLMRLIEHYLATGRGMTSEEFAAYQSGR